MERLKEMSNNSSALRAGRLRTRASTTAADAATIKAKAINPKRERKRKVNIISALGCSLLAAVTLAYMLFVFVVVGFNE